MLCINSVCNFADSKHEVHKHATALEKLSAHDHEHAKKGEKVIKNHKIVDEEKGGKKSKSHSSDAHQNHKHVQEHSALGAKVKAAVRQRKNNYSKVIILFLFWLFFFIQRSRGEKIQSD